MALKRTLPPGPKLPMAVQTAWWLARPIEFLQFCRSRYGDLFTVELAATGTCVVTSEPEANKRVFTGDGDELRAGEVNHILEPIVGAHSVLLLDGARHLRQRRLMLPAFQGERMKVYAELMQRIAHERIDRWRNGEVITLRREMQFITLEVVLRAVFGVNSSADLAILRERLERVLATADSPLSTLGLLPLFRQNAPLFPWRRFVRDRDRADRQIFAEIAKRRAEASADRVDVLSLLLSAVDDVDGSRLSDAELRDELVTLLLAGHETTATALSWAFERIMATPRVKERLEHELCDSTARASLTPARLSELPYLDATIKEALRLRPVIPMVGRKLHAPFTLREFELPAGIVIAPSVYLTHMNPQVYESPEEFRPERFLNRRPDLYGWLPFGGGIRRCLGMAFALYEMKVIMAAIASRFELSPAQPVPVRTVRRVVTFTPQYGMRVRVRRRAFDGPSAS